MHHNINLRRAAERVRGRSFQREPFREIHTLREFGHCHLTAALLDRHGSKEDSFRWRSSLELGEMWRAINATLDSEEWRRLLLQFSVLVALGGDSFRLDGKCSLLPCVAHPSENSKSRNTYCIRASNSSLILSYRFSYF